VCGPNLPANIECKHGKTGGLTPPETMKICDKPEQKFGK